MQMLQGQCPPQEEMKAIRVAKMLSGCYTHFESIFFFARAAAGRSVCLIIISDRFSEGIHAFQSQNKSRRPWKMVRELFSAWSPKERSSNERKQRVQK